jgi:hypothetical protein
MLQVLDFSSIRWVLLQAGSEGGVRSARGQRGGAGAGVVSGVGGEGLCLIKHCC